MQVRGIKPDNRVVEIQKLPDGSLRATQASGQVSVIAAEDEHAQAFIVYTMLHANELRAGGAA